MKNIFLSLTFCAFSFVACINHDTGHSHGDGTHEHENGEGHSHRDTIMQTEQEEFNIRKDSTVKTNQDHEYNSNHTHKH